MDIVKRFNAKAAFLNGKLFETIYMQQPEEYIVPVKKKIMYASWKRKSTVWNRRQKFGTISWTRY